VHPLYPSLVERRRLAHPIDLSILNPKTSAGLGNFRPKTFSIIYELTFHCTGSKSQVKILYMSSCHCLSPLFLTQAARTTWNKTEIKYCSISREHRRQCFISVLFHMSEPLYFHHAENPKNSKTLKQFVSGFYVSFISVLFHTFDRAAVLD